MERERQLLRRILEIILIRGAHHGSIASELNCSRRPVVACGSRVLVLESIFMRGERSVFRAHEVVHIVASHISPPSLRL